MAEVPTASTTALFGDDTGRRHDFGAVIGHPGLTLRHAYPLVNTTDGPVRILRAVNHKPCCGDVALKPTTLGPGEAETLEVFVRVGETLGPLGHFAAVETDHPGAEALEFVTTVTAHPRFRIEREGEAMPTLLPNEDARRTFVAFSYGTRDDPPPPLDESAIESALAVEWLGPAERRSLDGGVTEGSRSFSVLLTAAGVVGRRAEEIRLIEGGEIALRYPLRWEVIPAIRASPPGLVVSHAAGSTDRRVLLHSGDGRAFRIEGVESDLAGLDIQAESVGSKCAHIVEISIRPGPDNAGKAGRVSIATDHPGQPLVEVAIYISGGTDDVSEEDSR